MDRIYLRVKLGGEGPCDILEGWYTRKVGVVGSQIFGREQVLQYVGHDGPVVPLVHILDIRVYRLASHHRH